MKFTIENKTIEHTFVQKQNNKGITISWFKALHSFFKEDYFSNWIHNININYYYGNVYPTNLDKLFKPLQTELSKINVIFLFTGEELNIFSNGLGAGEDRTVKVPDNYLNDELVAFKEACIEYRINNSTSANCCEITPDFDVSLEYLLSQNVLLLNLNSIKTKAEESTTKLSSYYKPVLTEILDSVILSNEDLYIISPEDVKLSDYTNLKSCLNKDSIHKYIPKNKDSILKVFENVNISLLKNVGDKNIIEW